MQKANYTMLFFIMTRKKWCLSLSNISLTHYFLTCAFSVGSLILTPFYFENFFLGGISIPIPPAALPALSLAANVDVVGGNGGAHDVIEATIIIVGGILFELMHMKPL